VLGFKTTQIASALFKAFTTVCKPMYMEQNQGNKSKNVNLYVVICSYMFIINSKQRNCTTALFNLVIHTPAFTALVLNQLSLARLTNLTTDCGKGEHHWRLAARNSIRRLNEPPKRKRYDRSLPSRGNECVNPTLNLEGQPYRQKTVRNASKGDFGSRLA